MIEPALTEAEWAKLAKLDRFGEGPAIVDGTFVVWGEAGSASVHPDPLATAALCLHGRTGGFTWGDVDELRESARLVPEGYTVNEELLNLAERIAALLPPR